MKQWMMGWGVATKLTCLLIVQVLVRYRVSINEKNVRGNTALHLCATHNKPESLKLLLRSRATDLINCENSSGLTALEIAQNSGHQLCAELVCFTYTLLSTAIH